MNNTKSPRLLVIDDERAIRDVLTASLVDEGYSVQSASDGVSGLKAIEELKPDIVLLDIWMPGELDGLEVLKRVKSQSSEVQFIIMSGHGTIETAVRAVKWGAWDFVEKPLSMDKISILIKNILSFQNEHKEKLSLLNRLRKNLAILGDTAMMKELKTSVAQIARESTPVLIVGEPGAGKTLTANNIHYSGPRAGQNLVEFQCGRIPQELQTQGLFGSDAECVAASTDEYRKGRLELAHGGTLVIEEVSLLSVEAQAALLQYLKDGNKFKRTNGEETSFDVRFVFTSTDSLVNAVKEKRFSEELYYKLSQFTLRIPPLKEHLADVPTLIAHFGEQFVSEGGHELKSFSEMAMSAMQEYPWPGNVRELRNFVERLYILMSESTIELEDVRFAGLVEKVGELGQYILTFREARAEFEKEYLLKKIAENQGNISRTAEVIGLERSYLHRKIKAYGIEV